jgi:hypothetical protein
MSASLACQEAQRGLLVSHSPLTALVPATSIVDAHTLPSRFPCVLVGEGQELQLGDVVGVDRFTTLYSDYHVWVQEPGFALTKQIAGEVRAALAAQTWTQDGFRCLDTAFVTARYIRDESRETAHGIVTLKSTIERLPT